MDVKEEPESDSSLQSSDDEDLPPWPPSSSSTSRCSPVKRKKSKSIDERLKEQIELAETFKVENVAQDLIQEKLKNISIAISSSQSSEPDTPDILEKETKIFCVKDSLQFFNVKDITPVYCGYDNESDLTKFESDMLSFVRVELQNILPSFLLTCHPHCISDCKSFVSFLLHNISISNDAASVMACYHCIVDLLDAHASAEHIVFDSVEMFSLLFNYGIDVEDCQLLKWKPDLKACLSRPLFQSKSFNKIPDNWTFNFEFLLKSLIKIISTCIVKGEELSNILMFFLWSNFDSRIHSENLFCGLQDCIAVCIERIMEEMLIDVAKNLVKMDFSDDENKWDNLFSFADSIPNSTHKCCLLKKQIGFLSLNGLLLKEEDGFKWSLGELKLLISQLSGLKSETVLMFAAKFIDLCTCDVSSEIEECDRFCNHLKIIESTLPENAHLAKSSLCKTHARLKRNAFKSSLYSLPSFQRRQIYSPIKVSPLKSSPIKMIPIKIKQEVDPFPEAKSLLKSISEETDLSLKCNKPVPNCFKMQTKLTDFFPNKGAAGSNSKAKSAPTKNKPFCDPPVAKIKCEPDLHADVAGHVSSCSEGNRDNLSKVDKTGPNRFKMQINLADFFSNADLAKAGDSTTEGSNLPYITHIKCEPGMDADVPASLSDVSSKRSSSAFLMNSVPESKADETVLPDLPKISSVSSAVEVKTEPLDTAAEISATDLAASQPLIESTFSSDNAEPSFTESYSYEGSISVSPTPRIVSIESQAAGEDTFSNLNMDWEEQLQASSFPPQTLDSTPQHLNEFSEHYQVPNSSIPPVDDDIRRLFTSTGTSGSLKSGTASKRVGRSRRMNVDTFVNQVLSDIENPDILESSNSASFDAFPLPTYQKNVTRSRSAVAEEEIMIIDEVKVPEKRNKSCSSPISGTSRYVDKSKQSSTVKNKDASNSHDPRDRNDRPYKALDSSLSRSKERSELQVTVVSPARKSTQDQKPSVVSYATTQNQRPSVVSYAASSKQKNLSSHSRAETEDDITFIKEVKTPVKKKSPKATSQEKTQPLVSSNRSLEKKAPISTSNEKAQLVVSSGRTLEKEHTNKLKDISISKLKDSSTNKLKDLFHLPKDLIIKEIPSAPSKLVKTSPKMEIAPEIKALSKMTGLSITAIKNTNEAEDDEIMVVKEVQPLNKKTPPKKKPKPKEEEDIFFMRQSMGHEVRPDPPIVVDFQVVLVLNSVLGEVVELCSREPEMEDVATIVLPKNIPGLECVPLNGTPATREEPVLNNVKNSSGVSEPSLYSEDSTDRFISSGVVLDSIVQSVSLEPHLVGNTFDYAETVVAVESVLHSLLSEVSFNEAHAHSADSISSRQNSISIVLENVIQKACSLNAVPQDILSKMENLIKEVSLFRSLEESGGDSESSLDKLEKAFLQGKKFDGDHQVNFESSDLQFPELTNSSNVKELESLSGTEMTYKSVSNDSVAISMSLVDNVQLTDGLRSKLDSTSVPASASVESLAPLFSTVFKSDSLLSDDNFNPNFYSMDTIIPGLFSTSKQHPNSVEAVKEPTNQVVTTSASLSALNNFEGNEESKKNQDVMSKPHISMISVLDNLDEKLIHSLQVFIQKTNIPVDQEVCEALENVLDSVAVTLELSSFKDCDTNFEVQNCRSEKIDCNIPLSFDFNKENSCTSPKVSMSPHKVTKKKQVLKRKRSTCAPTILHLQKQKSPKKLSPLVSAFDCNKDCFPKASLSSSWKEGITKHSSKTLHPKNLSDKFSRCVANALEKTPLNASSSNSGLGAKRKSPDFNDPVCKITCLSSSPFKSADRSRTPKYKPYPSKLYHSPKKSNFFTRMHMGKSPRKSYVRISPKKPYVIRKNPRTAALLSKTGLALPHLLRQKLLPPSSNSPAVEEEILRESSSDSDVEILYQDPKYFADSDCIIIYEKDEVMLLD